MSSGFAWLTTTTVLMYKNGGGTGRKMGLPPLVAIASTTSNR
jgi:hypothetical protein